MNAKYCDKFPHVRWKDGQVVHVQVTPDIHRKYCAQMKMALDAIQMRCVSTPKMALRIRLQFTPAKSF